MITAYCSDPITLRTVTSRDQWNNRTTADAAIMGKVIWKTCLVRNIKGEQVVAAATVLIPGSIAIITHEDQIIIDGVEHGILSIAKKAAFSFSHWEVAIQ